MANDLRTLTDTALRHARRVIVLVIGGTVLLAGVAMLVLPGPGIVAVLVGLGILAAEFAWARRWLKRIKQAAIDVKDRVTGTVETRSDSRPTAQKKGAQ